VSQAGKCTLFTRWIRKVIKATKQKYALSLMAWDDMFRHWSVLELMTLRINGVHHF
jgi:hypothetical protein